MSLPDAYGMWHLSLDNSISVKLLDFYWGDLPSFLSVENIL